MGKMIKLGKEGYVKDSAVIAIRILAKIEKTDISEEIGDRGAVDVEGGGMFLVYQDSKIEAQGFAAELEFSISECR